MHSLRPRLRLKEIIQAKEGKKEKRLHDLEEQQNILLRQGSFYTHVLFLLTAPQISLKADDPNLLKLINCLFCPVCRDKVCMMRWKKKRKKILKMKELLHRALKIFRL